MEKRSVAAELALISLESLWTVQMTLDPVPTRKDHQLHWNRLCHHLRGLLVSLLFACCGEISRVLQQSPRNHTVTSCSNDLQEVMEYFQGGTDPVFEFDWY